jgi:hypothetical protein
VTGDTGTRSDGVGTILVLYRGAAVALVGVRRLSFLGDLRHLPPGDPVIRVVTHMAYYAGLVLAGEMPAPYTDSDAARFARFALIDQDELARSVCDSHEALAERFGVPVQEVVEARREFGEPYGR